MLRRVVRRDRDTNLSSELASAFGDCGLSAGVLPLLGMGRDIPDGHRDVDVDGLVAAITLPLAMPGVRRPGGTYLDAVWVKDANLIEAVRRGAEELWVLWCIGNTPAYRDGPFQQYVHMIEQSANGVLFEELDRIAELNAALAAGHAPYASSTWTDARSSCGRSVRPSASRASCARSSSSCATARRWWLPPSCGPRETARRIPRSAARRRCAAGSRSPPASSGCSTRRR